MMNKLLSFALVAVLAACGKSGASSGGGDTSPVALGTSGFTVDLPKGWTVEVPMEHFYDFKDNGRNARNAPQIMESSMSMGTLDETIKSHCDGRTVSGKDQLPGGGYWVTCKGESQMVKGVQTTKIMARIPKDDKSSFDCHYETDKDPEFSLAICKSIKKAGATPAK